MWWWKDLKIRKEGMKNGLWVIFLWKAVSHFYSFCSFSTLYFSPYQCSFYNILADGIMRKVLRKYCLPEGLLKKILKNFEKFWLHVTACISSNLGSIHDVTKPLTRHAMITCEAVSLQPGLIFFLFFKLLIINFGWKIV